MIAVGPLVAVYVAFAVKHVLADYYLQTGWMVRGKSAREGWVVPLAAHAGVHAAGTFLIAIAVRPSLWWLAPIDFVIHFAIDRGKSLTVLRLHLTDQDKLFWWGMGTDQFLHQLTHFAFVVTLLAW